MLETEALAHIAQKLRIEVLEAAHNAGSGHCGGSFSCAEILACLYHGGFLRHRAGENDCEERDQFVLSKGHAAPMLYAVLASCGFFPMEEMKRLRSFGSKLQGHPDMRKTPGVDMSTGSLGMGLSNAIGMAYAAKLKGSGRRVFVLLGDGELDEGQIWEAAMLAPKLKLENLFVLIDHNGVQLDGTTDEILPLGNLSEKFKAFGWDTFSCDGHDCGELLETYGKICREGKPAVVIAKTVKGKGVLFMEGNHRWHGKSVGESDFINAKAELERNLT